MKPTYVRKLDSGYWHVRFGTNRFVQWPKWRKPTEDDAFGWCKSQMVQAADKATSDAEPPAAEREKS